jgi:hypothetical protein
LQYPCQDAFIFVFNDLTGYDGPGTGTKRTMMVRRCTKLGQTGASSRLAPANNEGAIIEQWAVWLPHKPG